MWLASQRVDPMENTPAGFGRPADLTAAFKREQISRVLREEVTVAELSRELAVEQSVIRRENQLADRASMTAATANKEVVPASEPRVAQRRIKEARARVGAREGAAAYASIGVRPGISSATVRLPLIKAWDRLHGRTCCGGSPIP